MKKFDTVSGNDLMKMQFPEDETKAPVEKEKADYKKTLRELCPSEEIRKQAKRISARKDSCEKCVYCDGETEWCHIPHSDFRMEDLDIDPCYEGVLRYLVKEAETTGREESEAGDLPPGITALLYEQDMLLNIQNILISGQNTQIAEMKDDMREMLDSTFFTMETVCKLSERILQMTEENSRLSRAEIKYVHGLLLSMRAILREHKGGADASGVSEK